MHFILSLSGAFDFPAGIIVRSSHHHEPQHVITDVHDGTIIAISP